MALVRLRHGLRRGRRRATTADGAVALGMVYGPYDWFQTTEPTQILNSMIHVE